MCMNEMCPVYTRSAKPCLTLSPQLIAAWAEPSSELSWSQSRSFAFRVAFLPPMPPSWRRARPPLQTSFPHITNLPSIISQKQHFELQLSHLRLLNRHLACCNLELETLRLYFSSKISKQLHITFLDTVTRWFTAVIRIPVTISPYVVASLASPASANSRSFSNS